MKILLLSHLYPSSFNKIRGIFVHEHAKALIKQGCEVKVVAPVPLTCYPLNKLRKKWRNYHNQPFNHHLDSIEVFHPKTLLFPGNILQASSGTRMVHGIKKTVQDLHSRYKFDLIHAHVALPNGLAAVKLAADYHVPCVVTIHGQDLLHTVTKNKECVTSLAYCFKHAQRIIFVSHKLKELAVKYFPAYADKYCVVSNGIDLSQIVATKPKISKTIKMLSVGNLIVTKGIDYNLRAIAALAQAYPDLHYTIVGSGPEEGNLKRLVHQLTLQDKVQFTGAVSHERAMEAMANCDIFSLPSWMEGFGVVYIEAMAHGKPVIACQGEGIDGVVMHKETGILVKPKDIDSLISGMKDLLDNPEQAREIGEKAKQLVSQQYTWQQNAKKTIDIYRNL